MLKKSSTMQHMVRRKTEVFQMRLDLETKRAAQKAALDARRSLASLLEVLITDYLKARGYLSKTDLPPPRRKK
jgi:hypothetical protein